MPISGTSTDYSNRTKDISIFQGINPKGTALITPSFGRISNYCTGIQKLVQRYGISLITNLGSQVNFPTFGTSLISTLLNSNSNINKADVYPIFNKANSLVLKAFKAYQQANAGLPLDEQISTAVLTGVTVANGEVSLNIQIYPLSAEPVVLILPLPSN